MIMRPMQLAQTGWEQIAEQCSTQEMTSQGNCVYGVSGPAEKGWDKG